MEAALWGHDYDMVRNLLPTVDPNMMFGDRSIFSYIVEHGYPYDIINTLLKMGADVNWYSGCYSIPLQGVKDESIVRLLMTHGADEYIDDGNYTPCECAEYYQWFHLLHLFKQEPYGVTHKVIAVMAKQIICNTEIIDTVKTQLSDHEMFVSFHQLCNF